MAVAIPPVVLTAFLAFLSFVPLSPATTTDDPPALAAQAVADAERVVAVHEIPGAVVFDLDRAGELFQLTLSLDDDGAVVATAIDWRGPAPDGGTAPALLARIEHVDVDGGTVIIRDGATTARFAISR